MTQSSQEALAAAFSPTDSATSSLGVDSKSAKAEFEAMQTIHQALEPLPPQARERVVRYIISLLEIGVTIAAPRLTDATDAEVAAADEAAASAASYSSFADLYDAADPANGAEKALVAGYWLQVCEQNDTFTAQAANKLLTNLGHKIANITLAFAPLQNSKPALVLQVSKSGRSQQARKTLKLSRAGLNRVEEMINE